MMYLSRIELNIRLSKTQEAMASPHVMHAVVEASFPAQNRARNLWRIDKLGHSYYLLVVSEQEPDFRHVVEQFGWQASGQQWETKDYASFLQNISTGQQWGFRLRANPTHAESLETGRRGRVYGHVTASQQECWLEGKAAVHGFQLLSARVVQRETKRFRRGTAGGAVTLGIATFEGALEVVDPQLFVDVMTKGIGRAKAYGCGLLTLARS